MVAALEQSHEPRKEGSESRMRSRGLWSFLMLRRSHSMRVAGWGLLREKAMRKSRGCGGTSERSE